jgi:tRNA-2-methylthio-N6-dimethylallyladenosine synthase
MNENDSEHIAGILKSSGAEPTERPEDSDLIFVNTCAVREKSEKKLFSLLGRLGSLKKRKKDLFIAVVGCVAQLYRSKLLDAVPQIDLIMGPDNYRQIPEILPPHLDEKIISTEWRKTWNEIPTALSLRESRISAYVTIMEGCNNFCAYCVVPFTRGREKYRPLKQILDEIQNLANSGYKEIQLLGQNVNSYRDPATGTGFARLLRKVNTVSGIEWIRFITSHPKNFSKETALAMRESDKVCHQLHLPIQSGSTSVLERMNRGYTRDDYLKTIDTLRSVMPGISLSTDIIVGYPGETEKEFQDTLSVLERVRFANIFSFRYSPRPLTAAEKLEDDVPFEVKKNRLIKVQNLQKKKQSDRNKSLVGRTMRVLCTGTSKKNPSFYSGRNEGYLVVNFQSDTDVKDQFVSVKITSSGPYSLRGHALDK